MCGEGIRCYILQLGKLKNGQWLRLTEQPIDLEDEKEYELVMVRRPFGGVDSRGTHLGKEILVKNYFEVEEGDFLAFKRQIVHGVCGVVPHELANAVVPMSIMH